MAHGSQPLGATPSGPEDVAISPDAHDGGDRRRCVLRWVDVHPDYSTRSEVSDILAAIDAVGSASAR